MSILATDARRKCFQIKRISNWQVTRIGRRKGEESKGLGKKG